MTRFQIALLQFSVAVAVGVTSVATYDVVLDRWAFMHRAPAPPVNEAQPEQPPPHVYRFADFAGEPASIDARSIADWAVDAGDNQGVPFVIVDKVDAKVFVFSADGRLLGASAALLGLTRGDDPVPGLGQKKLWQISKDERTTPAGRFTAELGVNLERQQVLWVDYDAAIAIHAVHSVAAREHRLQRLASATPDDNRISYGCINVPRSFFRNVIQPVFTRTRGVVYVLPETRPAQVVFGSYNVPGGAPDPAATVARAQ